MHVFDILFLVILVGGGFCVIGAMLLSALLSKRPSHQKRFTAMDDRKLVETNVNARLMRRTLLITALLCPLLMLVAAPLVREPHIQRLLCCVAILTILMGLSASWLSFEIFRITEVEIQFRKFEKERNSTTEPADRGDS